MPLMLDYRKNAFYQEGKLEGILEGKLEGELEGVEKNLADTICKMYRKDQTIEAIAYFLEIEPEFVRQTLIKAGLIKA